MTSDRPVIPPSPGPDRPVTTTAEIPTPSQAVGPEPIIPAKPDPKPVTARVARRIYEEPFLKPEPPPYTKFEPPTSAALTPGNVTFLVGTSYNGEDPAHWCIWHEPYDQIIEALKKRQQQIAPGRGRFLVMEIQVRDTTAVSSEVTVV